ncbi:MAG: tRNA (cytidine(34)-2'-O)-methyltransferase [Phycisphaerales bacterium]|nr:tRNA (cytidine(34)-2'-O)-methyltransferase [Phycisphaerales bacterium]
MNDSDSNKTPEPIAAGSLSVPKAQIVLVEPEIPNNTGNIGRTCVTAGLGLHLVHPLGFDIDEKACRRAGLDYWPRLSLTEHADLDCYERDRPRKAGIWLFTSKGTRTLYEAEMQPGDHLVFGRESKGLPREMIERHADRQVCIPMQPDERSLNLSTCVGIAAYEFVRQMIVQSRIQVNDSGRVV